MVDDKRLYPTVEEMQGHMVYLQSHCDNLEVQNAKLRSELAELKADKERLDYLQRLTDEKKYTGKVILRSSFTYRGWRLHETELEGSVEDVRQAIDARRLELEE